MYWSFKPEWSLSRRKAIYARVEYITRLTKVSVSLGFLHTNHAFTISQELSCSAYIYLEMYWQAAVSINNKSLSRYMPAKHTRFLLVCLICNMISQIKLIMWVNNRAFDRDEIKHSKGVSNVCIVLVPWITPALDNPGNYLWVQNCVSNVCIVLVLWITPALDNPGNYLWARNCWRLQ